MNWLKRVLSHYGEPSTKRHVVFVASLTLCAVTAAVGFGCGVWIYTHGDLGSGAVAALTFAGGITAGLAGTAYRKRDGAAVPPAPGGTVVSGNESDAAGGGS